MTTTKLPVFLRIVKDGKLVEVKQFTGSQIVIGSGGEVDMTIPDGSVSPIHAMIEERDDGKYYLSDLGSQSGTMINGEKVVDAPLESGLEFQLGDVTLEFHVGVPRTKKSTGNTAVPAMNTPEIPKVSENTGFILKDPPRDMPKETPKELPKEVAKPMIAKPKDLPKPITKTPPPKVTPLTMPPPAKVSTTAGAATFGSMDLAVSTPSLKGTSLRPPAKKQTFAPATSLKMSEQTKSTKGGVLEVAVIWKDRLLTTYHFDKSEVVTIGSHPNNKIVLPTFGSIRLSHPLINIQGTATVILTQDMTGEVYRDGNAVSIDELRRSGGTGAGFQYPLQQGEVLKINVGEGVALIVKYVNNAPESRLIPLIDFNVNQLTGLILGLMGTALFLFYVYLYAPVAPEKPEDEQEPPRKAQFFYKKPPPVEVVPEEKPVAHNAAEEKKDKAPPAPSAGEEGASSAPKHTETQNKIAKAKGTTKSSAAAPAPKAPKPKDVTKSGLLGAFASKGMQDQLNQAYKGAGTVSGLSQSAKGSAAEGEGAGVGGDALKDVGANGNGTATVGIAGVKTKGRAGGVSGYGTGTLGAKKNASLIAGDDQATFSGTIDKDAIRRVVQANLKQIKACYERGLNRNPGLYGKITIQWTIGAGGHVTEASVKTTTMDSSEVENCAVARLRTWKFPEPPAGELAVVSYPFVFQAQE